MEEESLLLHHPRAAPRRFNPKGKAWLPILHTQRGPWHFTALYSNTARAHDLKKTGDWVVLYRLSARTPPPVVRVRFP